MNNILVLLTIFFTYSFLGWCAEVVLTLFKLKKFINRGFLIGPLCPIYGACAVLMTLLLNKYINEPIVLFILCAVMCATLEYITSFLMEWIFKNRWWDYYEYKFNINGRICLEFAFLFGIGGLFIMYIGNPIIYFLIDLVTNSTLKIIVIILSIIALIDLLLSLNVILTIKNISQSLKYDSTEIISKKVKEILITKNPIYRRIISAFPDMKPFNKMTILKQKLLIDKLKVKKDKKKIKQAKRDLKK